MGQAAKKSIRRDADLSARFTADEKRRVELAMAKTGQTASDFIRAAVIHSADQTLKGDAVAAFIGAIGAIGVPSDAGRRADQTYAEMLLQKHNHDKRRTR